MIIDEKLFTHIQQTMCLQFNIHSCTAETNVYRFQWNPVTMETKDTCPYMYMYPRLGGVGGTLDFKWQGWLNGGKNQNPKKALDQNLTPQKSYAKLMSHKNLFANYVPEICGNYHKIFRLLWIPKKIPKNPYIIPATWNLEYPLPPCWDMYTLHAASQNKIE